MNNGVPKLTEEERRSALDRAMKVRRERAPQAVHEGRKSLSCRGA